jgi:hypothetical protein
MEEYEKTNWFWVGFSITAGALCCLFLVFAPWGRIASVVGEELSEGYVQMAAPLVKQEDQCNPPYTERKSKCDSKR